MTSLLVRKSLPCVFRLDPLLVRRRRTQKTRPRPTYSYKDNTFHISVLRISWCAAVAKGDSHRLDCQVREKKTHPQALDLHFREGVCPSKRQKGRVCEFLNINPAVICTHSVSYHVVLVKNTHFHAKNFTTFPFPLNLLISLCCSNRYVVVTLPRFPRRT